MHLHDTAEARGLSYLLNAIGDYSPVGHRADDGLSFAVRVVDARKVWGRVDILIAPISGAGQAWVALTSVQNLRVP